MVRPTADQWVGLNFSAITDPHPRMETAIQLAPQGREEGSRSDESEQDGSPKSRVSGRDETDPSPSTKPWRVDHLADQSRWAETLTDGGYLPQPDLSHHFSHKASSAILCRRGGTGRGSYCGAGGSDASIGCCMMTSAATRKAKVTVKKSIVNAVM